MRTSYTSTHPDIASTADLSGPKVSPHPFNTPPRTLSPSQVVFPAAEPEIEGAETISAGTAVFPNGEGVEPRELASGDAATGIPIVDREAEVEAVLASSGGGTRTELESDGNSGAVTLDAGSFSEVDAGGSGELLRDERCKRPSTRSRNRAFLSRAFLSDFFIMEQYSGQRGVKGQMVAVMSSARGSVLISATQLPRDPTHCVPYLTCSPLKRRLNTISQWKNTFNTRCMGLPTSVVLGLPLCRCRDIFVSALAPSSYVPISLP
jgi:hypothetical protein